MKLLSQIAEIAGASSVIYQLIDKAINYVRGQYNWKTNLQEESQNLECILLHSQAFVSVAGDGHKLTPNESSDPSLIKWQRQFRNGIIEAEEVLDDLKYLELEEKAKSDTSSLSRMVDASVKYAKRSLKFDDVLGRLRTCLENLNTSASDVKNFLALVTPSSDQNRTTFSLPDNLSFKGREEQKEEIIQYLLGESVEESEIQISENVDCLALVAMGGMGKTALSQQVFNHFENVKKEHFDIKIWVHVSTVLNASSLVKKILEHSTGQSESVPLELIPEKLKDKLHSKRFLLVLDDAWDDNNQREWEKLCAPLLYGKKGSWILLTTRLRSVATMVLKVIKSTMKPLTLRGLSKDECGSLLYEHAFAGQDPSKFPQLKEIVEEKILKKLDGVPLLAKSIGGALNKKLTEDHWTSISRSELWTMSQDNSNSEFIPALTLSYKMLTPRLQRCFSYCSIFPQDYRFKKQKLVCMWVAAGLIYKNESEEGKDEEDIANRCFDMLCDKSFFDVHTYNRSPFWESTYFYDIREDFYTMHNMLNGLARHVSRYECCRIVHGTPSRILDYNAIRHISIASCTDAQLHDLAKIVCKFKHLRTLWIQHDGHPKNLDDFIRDACKSPRIIRVLIIKFDYSGSYYQCLKSISDFAKLRFLEMSGFSPPWPKCKFYFLQVLIGNKKNVIMEEEDANKLTNLRHLYGVQDDTLCSVAKVGNLTSLQELCFTVGTKDEYKIDELMNMANLRQLSIAKLSNVHSLEEANKVDLVNKSSLTRLGLGWDEASSNPDLHQQALEVLQPPRKIKELFITRYKGGTLAPWMDNSSLSSLEYLQLGSCTSLEKLPPLWKLPLLKFLKLCDMEALRSLGCHFSGQLNIQFPVLEELEFRDLPLWEEWNGADDYIWFPRLKSFIIQNCSKLKKIPDIPLSIENLCMRNLGLEALPRSYNYKCSNGSRTFGGFQQLMSLESLQIYNCPGIVHIGSIGEEDDHLLPSSLKTLELENIDEHNLTSYLRGLTLLTTLHLHCSPGLKSLPLASELEHLIALQDLSISKAESLTSPGGLYILKSLKSLKIFYCPKFLSAMVDSQESILPSSLEYLKFEVSNISEESLDRCLQGLTSLKWLNISHFQHLRSLPNIEYLHNLTALHTLRISNCKELCELKPLTALVSLRKLYIVCCPHLQSLPTSLESFSSLKVLAIYAAPELKSLPKMPDSLERLKIDGCSEKLNKCHQENIDRDWPNTNYIEIPEGDL